jgi:hypothetical protein
MKQNNVSHQEHMTEALLTIGWVVMVPGQSLVLYSRLHLISQNYKLLRFTFCLICINAVILCVPTSTLNLRQYTKHPEHYTRGYVIMEKIQMTIFTLQEIFISCIYFWEIRRIMKVIGPGDVSIRKCMWQLVAMNVLLVILDVVLLTVEYMNYYMIETTFKSLVYSVKLKVEFGVLSQIVSVMKNRSEPNSMTLALPKGFGDLEKGQEDVMQHNLPSEWRLSATNTRVQAPDLIQIRRERESVSRANSWDSLGIMYPGRLG